MITISAGVLDKQIIDIEKLQSHAVWLRDAWGQAGLVINLR
jgi:hypothetical protein